MSLAARSRSGAWRGREQTRGTLADARLWGEFLPGRIVGRRLKWGKNNPRSQGADNAESTDALSGAVLAACRAG